MKYNSEIQSAVLDEEQFRCEVVALLQSLVDAEFEKDDDDIDFDFIDECTDAILSINSLDFECSPQLYEKIISKVKSNSHKSIKFTKALILVAVILTMGITAYASNLGNNSVRDLLDSFTKPEREEVMIEVESTTKKKEKPTAKKHETTAISYQDCNENGEEETTISEEDAISQTQPKKKEENIFKPSSVSFENHASSSTTETTTKKVNMETAQYMELCFDSNVKTTYKVGDCFNGSGMYVKIHYTDTYVTKMPVKYCKVSGFDTSAAGTYSVTLSYKNVSNSYTITVVE